MPTADSMSEVEVLGTFYWLVLKPRRKREPMFNQIEFEKELASAYELASNSHGPHPTQEIVAEIIGVTDRTLRYYFLRGWGCWPPKSAA